MLRGDIYWANLNPTVDSEQSGTRPVLIVSRNSINNNSPVVVVIPMTKYQQGKRIYPSHHQLEATKSNGLKVKSVVKCEQIRAISKTRLNQKLGTIVRTDLTKVMEALKIVLDL